MDKTLIMLILLVVISWLVFAAVAGFTIGFGMEIGQWIIFTKLN